MADQKRLLGLVAALLLAVLKEVTAGALLTEGPVAPCRAFVSVISKLCFSGYLHFVSCGGRDEHNLLHLHSQL